MTTAIENASESTVESGGEGIVEYAETFLRFRRIPTLVEAAQVMSFIEFEEENLAWHHGDFLNAVFSYFGEASSQLTGEKLARKATTRRNVSEKFKVDQRFPSLTFSHHQEVVSISDINLRQELLQLAADNDWTVSELREQKNKMLGRKPKPKIAKCPGCGPEFELGRKKLLSE